MKKEFNAKHEVGVISSGKELKGLVLKKVKFLDVPKGQCFHGRSHGGINAGFKIVFERAGRKSAPLVF